MEGIKTMKNFENLIEKAKQECQEIQASNINDILNISFDKYLMYSYPVQQEISNILSEYFIETLPLFEKLALNNFIGYFDSGMAEYTFIALDISKFDDFLKNTSYSGITDILDSNRLEIHTDNYFKTRAGALKRWESIVRMEPYYGLAEITIKEVDILGSEVF